LQDRCGKAQRSAVEYEWPSATSILAESHFELMISAENARAVSHRCGQVVGERRVPIVSETRPSPDGPSTAPRRVPHLRLRSGRIGLVSMARPCCLLAASACAERESGCSSAQRATLKSGRPTNAPLRRSTGPTCFGVTLGRPFGVQGRLTEAKYLLGLPCGSCPHRASWGGHRRTGRCGSQRHRTGTTRDPNRGRPATLCDLSTSLVPLSTGRRLAADSLPTVG